MRSRLTRRGRVRKSEILNTRARLNITSGRYGKPVLAEPVCSFPLKSLDVFPIDPPCRDGSDHRVQHRARECREEMRKQDHGSSPTRSLPARRLAYIRLRGGTLFLEIQCITMTAYSEAAFGSPPLGIKNPQLQRENASPPRDCMSATPCSRMVSHGLAWSRMARHHHWPYL